MREGLALLEQTLGAVESVGERFFRSLIVVRLGEAHLLADRRADARPFAAQALAWPLSAANAATRPGPSASSVMIAAHSDPPDDRAEGHYRRPRQDLPADGPARRGPRPPHHRDDHIPRDGHDVLAGAGGGGDEGVSLVGVDRREPCLGTNSCARAARKALR